MIESKIVDKTTKYIDFPKLMTSYINGEIDIIVLMTGISEDKKWSIGTVVYSNRKKNIPIGCHNKDWLYETFSDFSGEISLKNL